MLNRPLGVHGRGVRVDAVRLGGLLTPSIVRARVLRWDMRASCGVCAVQRTLPRLHRTVELVLLRLLASPEHAVAEVAGPVVPVLARRELRGGIARGLVRGVRIRKSSLIRHLSLLISP